MTEQPNPQAPPKKPKNPHKPPKPSGEWTSRIAACVAAAPPVTAEQAAVIRAVFTPRLVRKRRAA